jgi:hypothetical protein
MNKLKLTINQKVPLFIQEKYKKQLSELEAQIMEIDKTLNHLKNQN